MNEVINLDDNLDKIIINLFLQKVFILTKKMIRTL